MLSQKTVDQQEHKIELSYIFRIHGPAYRDKFGHNMLPSHQRAMEDIENCRTEELGGHVFYYDTCQDYRYSYHSCKNRNCPKCGHENAKVWLDKQKTLRLPVTYFMVTFTLHDNLRRLAGSHQRLIYDLLFRTSAAALQKLVCNPEWMGGQIGMVGILQTWTRDLSVLHPHMV